MKNPKWIVLTIVIICLSVILLLKGPPPILRAQGPGSTFRIYLPVIIKQTTGELTDAQSYGMVMLPDPDAPGDDLLSDSGVAGGLSPNVAVVGTNVRAAGGPNTGTQAEISSASSGTSIVITFNDLLNPANADNATTGYVTSIDGGISFSPIQNFPQPAGSNSTGDPVLVADLLGRFYFVQIFDDDGANAPNPGNCTNSMHVSTDGGQTFSNIVGSPFSFAPGTTEFPDQPHMGIDRLNLVSGQPQLYVFTRHFLAGINCPRTGGTGTVQGEVVCSTDGGVNWTAPIVLSPYTDNAHFATGSDASVYIVGNGTGTMANTTRILLRRSTNDCNTGVTFGSPVVVVDNLTFGPTGIDREVPQPYVAVDKIDPNIVYVAWSSDRLTGDGDRDIFLARCTFTGTAGSCEAANRINDNPIGDGTAQYFPMMCVDPNNVINLSWNDQRAGGNSTAIFHTEVIPASAGLSVGPSFLTSEINFTPFNFVGMPDYGDYNENNDACDGQHFYAAWTSHVSPPGILPASNDPDVFFAVINNLMDVRVKASLDFGDICLGDSQVRPLEIFNVGDATLTVNNVSRIAGSTDITVDPNPTVPLTISPDGQVNFDVRCTPTSLEPKTATIRIETDDPDQPQIDLTATCNVAEPDINASIANNGDFGDICLSDQKDLTLQVLNQGACNLEISNINSSNLNNFILPATLQFPLVLRPGAHVDVPIRFQPDNLQICSDTTARTGNITINSDDPDEPTITQELSGTVPCPVATTSGQLNFGELCTGGSQTETVQLCDTGKCNLTVTGAALAGPDCDDLTLVSPNPPPTPANPLIISPDFCFGFVVEFEPDDLTPPVCSLEIFGDDPTNPTVVFPIEAGIGAPNLVLDPPDLNGIFAFPPTVTDPNGDLACFSDKTMSLRNNGTCPAEITSIAATASPPFEVIAPTVFPITLPPGEETLDVTVRFAPTTGGGSVTSPDETTGTLTIVSNDPAGDVAGQVCGEAVVQSGGRWLVVDGADNPIDSVDSLTLQSKGIHEPAPIDIRLTDVAPTTTQVCGNTIRFHLNREDLPPTHTTGNNPLSSYTINAKDGNKQVTKSFFLGPCEFTEDVLRLQ